MADLIIIGQFTNNLKTLNKSLMYVQIFFTPKILFVYNIDFRDDNLDNYFAGNPCPMSDSLHWSPAQRIPISLWPQKGIESQIEHH